MENLNNEYEKEYQEYLERIQEENREEEDYSKLNTGITAIDETYFLDKRVESLINVFNGAIAYIKSHTDLTEDEIKHRINKCILQIEFEEEYPENPNGIGYVDNIFRILSININILKEDPEVIYEFIKHEMTHMIGLNIIKPLFKKPVMISGYTRESAFDLEGKEENEYFNEATVEMFIVQDKEYREEKILDYTISTNQDLNGDIYWLNSNLIHQMLIAQGIKELEFFRGLYDYKKSKQIIGKFKKGTFQKLSLNMDSIFEELIMYDDMEDEIDRLQGENSLDVSNQVNQMSKHKSKLESIISSSERMIIDKILLPRLKKVKSAEKQQILSEYYNFIISEKGYFKLKTNYRAITLPKESKSPWLQHVDVEQLSKKGELNKDIEKQDKEL